jgi:hypothetical protein
MKGGYGKPIVNEMLIKGVAFRNGKVFLRKPSDRL